MSNVLLCTALCIKIIWRLVWVVINIIYLIASLGSHITYTIFLLLCTAGVPTCSSLTAPCHQNAICSDTTEKIICICRAGYTGNGTGTDGCIPIPTTMTTTMTTNTTNSMTTTYKEGGKMCIFAVMPGPFFLLKRFFNQPRDNIIIFF